MTGRCEPSWPSRCQVDPGVRPRQRQEAARPQVGALAAAKEPGGSDLPPAGGRILGVSAQYQAEKEQDRDRTIPWPEGALQCQMRTPSPRGSLRVCAECRPLTLGNSAGS